MSYKARFSWISMNVLMCVGFLVFFDSHSTSYLEMSYLYHVYIISHNVSRNKAKSKGMWRHTVSGILYSQKCFLLAYTKSKTPLTTLFWGIFQRRAFFFGNIRIDGWLNLHRPHSHEPNHYDTDPRFNGLWALWDSPPRKKKTCETCGRTFFPGKRWKFFSRFFFWVKVLPIESMYRIFTHIYHKNQPKCSWIYHTWILLVVLYAYRNQMTSYCWKIWSIKIEGQPPNLQKRSVQILGSGRKEMDVS